jgi:putative endonuclease
VGGRLALTTGAAAEQAVALLLAEQGWQVLARNWRGAGGELDLVVQQRGRVRFVEVKLRQADDPVGLECVDGRKLARVRRAAEAWLQDYTDLVTEACLMVALVHGEPGDLRVHLFDDPD